jgi:hypothetical protein
LPLAGSLPGWLPRRSHPACREVAPGARAENRSPAARPSRSPQASNCYRRSTSTAPRRRSIGSPGTQGARILP